MQKLALTYILDHSYHSLNTPHNIKLFLIPSGGIMAEISLEILETKESLVVGVDISEAFDKV